MNRPLSDDEIVDMVKASDSVPEPSPLFWEHAARRVRTAVDAEPPRRSAWSPRPAVTAGGLLAASLAAWLVVAPRPSNVPPGSVDAVSVAPVTDADVLDEDSWTLLTSLSDELDVEAATGAGLVAGETTIRALEGLDADERAELATLLNRALEEPEI